MAVTCSNSRPTAFASCVSYPFFTKICPSSEICPSTEICRVEKQEQSSWTDIIPDQYLKRVSHVSMPLMLFELENFACPEISHYLH